MASDAQNEANRANAQHSTGPRTEAGKAASSRNALKHGLTAVTVLLPGEDPAEYKSLCDGMMKDLAPLNTTESALAAELIDLQWRLLRVSRIEARILSADTLDTRALNNLSLHTSRTKRQYSTTLSEYTQMHTANLRARNARVDDATTIYQADQILKRPTTLHHYGFDFTLAQLEDYLKRAAGLEEAKNVVDDFEGDAICDLGDFAGRENDDARGQDEFDDVA
jgi:hypothetical protein